MGMNEIRRLDDFETVNLTVKWLLLRAKWAKDEQIAKPQTNKKKSYKKTTTTKDMKVSKFKCKENPNTKWRERKEYGEK